MKDVTTAYPIGKSKDNFISRRAYETDFLRHLSYYVELLKLPAAYMESGYELDPAPDYLLVNIDTWGLKLFVYREQGKIDMPFLIFFHVIYGQDIYLSYLLPLLRPEDIIVVGSRYAKNCLLNISGEFDRAHVIPLTLDVEEIAAAAPGRAAGKEPGRKNIAYLGQLIPEKGIGELIECMPRIVSGVKDEVSLSVIGPKSGRDVGGEKSGYVQELQNRAEELGVSGHIDWLGALMGPEKYRVLSQADIFVNPGAYKIETFGVVNIEALACGLPVVCSRWSAFPEIVREGENGYLIDVSERDDYTYGIDREQFIARITGLLNDDERLRRMQEQARQSAYGYHFRELTPKLVKLLKKREAGIKGNWEEIKDKSFLDYSHLFRKEWLEVIGVGRIEYGTYGRVYEEHGPGIDFTPRMRHEAFKYLADSPGTDLGK